MDHARLQRRMVAVLLADVVGYTRLMGFDEENTHLRLKRISNEVVDPRAAQYGGRFIRSMGDGMLIEFDSAIDAVRFAIDVQGSVAEIEEQVTPEARVQLRMGINIGDVIVDSRDIYGQSVNIAARLEQLAEPGAVYVTSMVHAQLRGYPSLRFSDKGKHVVKNIPEPIHVFRVQDAGIEKIALSGSFGRRAWRRITGTQLWRSRAQIAAVLTVTGTVGMSSMPHYRPARPPPHGASVLVLPFHTIGADGGQQYLADAVTEDVTTDLSRVRDLTVIAPATAFYYKGRSVDTAQLNRDIGVRYLVTGSIGRIGQLVSTNIQLVDASSGVQIWGERFQDQFIELEKLEQGITGRIASTLDIQLIQAEGRRAQRAIEPDALDLRLRATSLRFQAVTPENMMAARNLLIRATNLDPNSAEAWARLAQLTASDYLNHWNHTGPAELANAEDAARKALALDPNLAIAHLARGYIERAQGQHQLALDAFARAIDLDPNLALAYAQKAEELTLLGHPGDAPPLVEEALRLSPRDPSVGTFDWFIGRANFFAGRYDQAIPWLQRSVEARPNLWYNRLYLVSSYALAGDLDRAREALDDFRRRSPDPIASVATVIRYEQNVPAGNAVAMNARANFHRGLIQAGMVEQ